MQRPSTIAPIIATLLLMALNLTAGCSGTGPTPIAAQPSRASISEGEANDRGPLVFTRNVGNEVSMKTADLQDLGVVEMTIEHPKDGKQMYAGLALTRLIEAAKPSTDAALIFTASDAYTVHIPLADVQQCSDCIVAFDGDSFGLIMPDSGSSFWVKDIISIEAR